MDKVRCGLGLPKRKFKACGCSVGFFALNFQREKCKGKREKTKKTYKENDMVKLKKVGEEWSKVEGI